MVSCSTRQEKQIVVVDSPNEQQIPSNIQNATLFPEIPSKEITLKRSEPVPQELKSTAVMDSLKRMPLRKLFSNNMPFTENKGQLDKWYGIKLDRIGDIDYYTQAFGGTAYFGENGIGIGFYIEQMNDLHAERNVRKHPKGGKSLFFYIDHLGKNDQSVLQGIDMKETKMNFFKGEPKDHITGISNYDGVMYQELYKKIDLKYSIVDGALIYDYVVKPGGKVSDIRRSFEGVNKVEINAGGELEVYTDWGILIDKKIYAYQMINGKEKEVKVKYKKLSKTTAGFEVIGNYNRSQELIIDPPTLSFCTWVTPGGIDGYIHDMTVDAAGNIYAAGWINGSSSGTLVSPFDNVPAGGDAVVFKLNSTGTSLTYASFIGGDGNGGTNEAAFGVAVNASNQLYVAGFTDNATGFPTAGTIAAPFSTASAGDKDIFVMKLTAAGTGLIYSALYGGAGDDRAFDIAVNPSSDQAYITGWTTSSGLNSAGAYQTTKQAGGAVGYDAFVLKVSDATAGTVTRDYFTYLGGTDEDMGRAIAVTAGEAFITGVTQSSNYPRTTGATFGGGGGGGAFDAFVTRVNTTGTGLTYSIFLGGDFDEKGEGIAVSSSGQAYVTGWTKSILRGTVAAPNPGSFPVVNPLAGYSQNAASGGNVRDAFVTRVSATGTILNSFFMGCPSDDNVKNGVPFGLTVQNRGSDIAVNASGNVAVLMTTDGGGASPVLPTTNAVQSTFGGGNTGLGDAYVFVLTSDMQTITFATYFGGSDNDYPTAGVEFDPANIDCLIIGGDSHSPSIPTTAGVYTPTRIGGTGPDENYVTKYCNVPLPVSLLAFEGHRVGETIVLNWTTASETNSDYFIVEKSTDGVTFYPIGKVKAAGNTTEMVNYSLVDENPSIGTNYYRLNEFDFDATHHYSKTISVNVNLDFVISPNPGDGLYNLESVLTSDAVIQLNVYSGPGQEIISISESKPKGICNMQLDLRAKADGMYILKITSGGQVQTVKLVKR